MYKIQRKLLSQNFLHSQKLVSKLIGSSSIGKNDLVLDIGAGKGIITSHLLLRAKHVIAIEIDPEWVEYVKRKFGNRNNITIHKADICTYKLPRTPYKVFANIPFSIEGKIIRLLIDAKNPPEDCYLIMMKELAYRLEARNKEHWFSTLHKPWFEFKVLYKFNRTDFIPAPSVDAVLLRIKKRKDPLLPTIRKKDYQKLVTAGYKNGQPIYKNLKDVYGRKRVALAMQKLYLSREIKPSKLTVKDWINFYLLLGL